MLIWILNLMWEQRLEWAERALRKIIEKLKYVYLGPIGFEYNFIRNDEIRQWFFQKCEQEYFTYNPSIDEKKRILTKLNEAVVFENFLHTKFLGQKRFSLEGGENTIPALQTIINKAAELDVKEVVIGMAHRGTAKCSFQYSRKNL